MDALSISIVLGLIVMLIAFVAFAISVKSGQYDDLDGPAHRILMDDDDPRIPGNVEIRERLINKNNRDQ